jgi:hypothetical protein
MESTLLGLAMPSVLHPLKDCLKQKGFIVQTMPTPNPVLVAYRKGNWLRSARQLIIELICIENHLTRVDITVIKENSNENFWTDHAIEGNFASFINNYFKKVTH